MLPALGEAGDTGQATAENLDSVASARYKLRHNGQWVAAFDRMDATLARRATKMRPARFRQWLGGIVTILSDDGSTDLASERVATASVWDGIRTVAYEVRSILMRWREKNFAALYGPRPGRWPTKRKA